MVKETRGFWSRMFGRIQLSETELHGHGDVGDFGPVHLLPTGSSGTDITGGVLNEEYLAALSGTPAMDTFDKMRRSDPKIKMCVNSVVNPIKGATWSVDAADDSDEAKKNAELMEQSIFGMDKRWKQILHEIMSMATFGYSLFERTHKVVFDDPKFGTHITLRNLNFRSQRTIERWELDEQTGDLLWVEQWAFGDAQRATNIPAKFLSIFTMDREGQNFEGVSMLRPAYGPWIRKQTYLKLQAIGIEKFAVPTPIMTIPEGKENTEQFNNAVDVLKAYTSHQCNYLTKPEGWDLNLEGNDFDPAKVQTAIDSENKEMVNAFMANFLELGQTGSGSYALSNDLSDFFLAGLEHIGSVICEEFNDVIIPELMRLNFGPKVASPKLVCSGISDKAGKELADVLGVLTQSKVIIPDDVLEAHMRKRYKLPEASTDGQREIEAMGAPPVTFQESFQRFLEDEKKNIQLAETARGQIVKAEDPLRDVMDKNLRKSGQKLVDQLMAKYKKLGNTTKINAVKQVEISGRREFEKELLVEVEKIAARALTTAKKEVPIRLSESITFAEFEDLPSETRRKLKAQSQLVIDTQLKSLESAVFLEYSGAINETTSADVIRQDMLKKVDNAVEKGTATRLGAVNLGAFVVNESRNGYFFQDDVRSQISAFRFSNPNPKTPICQDLTGRIFSPDDVRANQFYPPLHHNCKSFLAPILVARTPEPKIDERGLTPSNPRLEKFITLGEKDA